MQRQLFCRSEKKAGTHTHTSNIDSSIVQCHILVLVFSPTPEKQLIGKVHLAIDVRCENQMCTNVPVSRQWTVVCLLSIELEMGERRPIQFGPTAAAAAAASERLHADQW